MLAVLASLGALPAHSQGARAALTRLRALAAQGDSAGALRVADSLAADGGGTAEEQAEGLLWRGTVAPTVRERRVALARVIVDFPQTSVAGDALFRIAQMDLADGDRASARRQLQRAYRDYGGSTSSGDAAFELGQILLGDGELRDGCAALDSAIQRTPANQVEKRNRMTYVRRPCAQLMAEPATDSTVPQRGAPVPATAENAPANQGRTARLWSAQVGAFASKEDADRIVARLVARGYEARVTPEAPFRVRIGRFSTRAEAATLVTKLKGERTAAILVEAERR